MAAQLSISLADAAPHEVAGGTVHGSSAGALSSSHAMRYGALPRPHQKDVGVHGGILREPPLTVRSLTTRLR